MLLSKTILLVFLFIAFVHFHNTDFIAFGFCVIIRIDQPMFRQNHFQWFFSSFVTNVIHDMTCTKKFLCCCKRKLDNFILWTGSLLGIFLLWLDTFCDKIKYTSYHLVLFLAKNYQITFGVMKIVKKWVHCKGL